MATITNQIKKPFLIKQTPVITQQVLVDGYSYFASDRQSILNSAGAAYAIQYLKNRGYNTSGVSASDLASASKAGLYYFLFHTSWTNGAIPAAASNVAGWYIQFVTNFTKIGGTTEAPKAFLLSDSHVTIPLGGGTVTVAPYYQTVTSGGDIEAIYDEGWNSAGTSARLFSGDGEATFQVKNGTLAAVAGLNIQSGALSALYTDILYGFYVSSGGYVVIESGSQRAATGSYDEDTIFKIVRDKDGVRYYVDDVLIYTSLATITAADLLLDVSLFASGDAIINGTLTDAEDITDVVIGEDQVFSSSADLTNGILTVGSDVVYQYDETLESTADLTWQATFVIGDQTFASSADMIVTAPIAYDTAGGNMVMQAMTAIGSQGAYSLGYGEMQPLTGEAYDVETDIKLSGGRASMFPLTANAHGLTGGISIGSTPQQMMPLVSIGSEGEYSYGYAEMQPLTASGDALAVPDVVPGTGAVKIDDGTYQGSGYLLKSGKHILTAASLMDLLTLEDITLTFNSFLSIDTAVVFKVTKHPNWNSNTGENPARNYNLAIIELVDQVDPRIERHEIYRASDEIDQTFLKTSYSQAIDPQTGDYLGYYSFETIANRYELDAKVIRSEAVLDSQLAYDFDNGLTVNDAFAIRGKPNIGEGEFEGFVQAQDIGGGSLIDNKIAGITNWYETSAYDVDEVTNSTYGEVASDTRVAFFADWIDANTIVVIGAAELGRFTTTITGYGGGSASIRPPDMETTAQGQANTANEANELGGFSTTIEAYTGGVMNASNLRFTLIATATNEPVGRATLRFPTPSITAQGGVGAVGIGDLKYTLLKSVTALGGAQANNIGSLNTTIQAGALSGSVVRASLRPPIMAIVASGESRKLNIGVIRPPYMESLYGLANLDGFDTDITAKAGFDCEVL